MRRALVRGGRRPCAPPGSDAVTVGTNYNSKGTAHRAVGR